MAEITYDVYDSGTQRAIIITEQAAVPALTDAYVKTLYAKMQTDGVLSGTDADIQLNVDRGPTPLSYP